MLSLVRPTSITYSSAFENGIYRASLVSPFPAVSGRVSLMLQRRSAFHGGKAQTPIRLFQGLSGAYSPFLLPRGGSGLDRKQPYQRHLAAGHPALHLGHLREGPVPDRRPDLLPPPHHQGRGGRRRHRRGKTWARSRGGYVPGVTSRRGRWCVPPRCTNPGRHRSHRASRPWRTGPRRHWIAWGDEPSPLMPASGRWRRRMAFRRADDAGTHIQTFIVYLESAPTRPAV